MWTIKQIAERDKVSKQAVSKTVGKMRADKGDDGIELDALGRVAKVSVAHYDEYRQRYVNPAKAAAPIRNGDETPVTADAAVAKRQEDSFDEARRQGEWIKVQREALRLQEQRGQLIRADRQREAAKMVGAEIQVIINRLPNKADDLASAFSRDGVHGLRLKLRDVATEMLTLIADKLNEIALAAPDEDDLIEEE
jgi:hypothetical protein